jgi:hypothetical protein
MTDTSEARRALLAAMAGGLALSATRVAAQPYVPKFEDRPELLTGDETGFAPIFDGRTLKGWEGDPAYWRAEAGAIVGQVVPATKLKSNSFLIWRGGSPADFELRLDCRLSNPGNSGINYRSTVIPDPVTPANRFSLRGNQCDIDAAHGFTGNSYEEKGRMFLALRGQATHVTGLAKPSVLASLGDPDDLGRAIGPDWNAFHIIARGALTAHIINGRLMTLVLDDDPAGRREGLIGVQVHQGFPQMKAEFRNVRLKRL